MYNSNIRQTRSSKRKAETGAESSNKYQRLTRSIAKKRCTTRASKGVALPQVPLGWYNAAFQQPDPQALVSSVCNLSNRIHPLFVETQFTSGVDFDVIGPCARLATLLLQTDVAKKMAHTILYHTRLVELERKAKSGKILRAYLLAESNPKRHLTNTQTSEASKALEKLADAVTFSDDSDDGKKQTRKRSPRKSGTGAYTLPLNDKFQIDKNHQGNMSNIFYSLDLYNQLHAAHHARKQDGPLLLQLRFEFACMLFHETFHALFIASEGSTADEYFAHPEARIAEIGHEAESRLFGGLIKLLWGDDKRRNALRLYRKNEKHNSQLRGIIAKFPWPTRGDIAEYDINEADYCKHNVDTLPKVDVVWRVPVSFYSQLFQSKFWENHAKNGQTALEPAVEHGYCFRSYLTGSRVDRVPCIGDPMDIDANHSLNSETGEVFAGKQKASKKPEVKAQNQIRGKPPLSETSSLEASSESSLDNPREETPKAKSKSATSRGNKRRSPPKTKTKRRGNVRGGPNRKKRS